MVKLKKLNTQTELGELSGIKLQRKCELIGT